MSDSLPLPADPGHAFLQLGERLRARGQLDAALSVALAGVGRFPGLASAHDLVGRIRADHGDEEGARSAWIAGLECDRFAIGPLKGLAFLAFRRQDLGEAERRLETAAQADPHDASILAALDRVRASRPLFGDEVLSFDAGQEGLLLFDRAGLHLAGSLGSDRPVHGADAGSAAAIGLLREASRSARLLELGAVRHLLVEGRTQRVAVAPVDAEGGVLLRRPATAPPGRVVAMAERAVRAARDWMANA